QGLLVPRLFSIAVARRTGELRLPRLHRIERRDLSDLRGHLCRRVPRIKSARDSDGAREDDCGVSEGPGRLQHVGAASGGVTSLLIQFLADQREMHQERLDLSPTATPLL